MPKRWFRGIQPFRADIFSEITNGSGVVGPGAPLTLSEAALTVVAHMGSMGVAEMEDRVVVARWAVHVYARTEVRALFT